MPELHFVSTRMMRPSYYQAALTPVTMFMALKKGLADCQSLCHKAAKYLLKYGIYFEMGDIKLKLEELKKMAKGG